MVVLQVVISPLQLPATWALLLFGWENSECNSPTGTAFLYRAAQTCHHWKLLPVANSRNHTG